MLAELSILLLIIAILLLVFLEAFYRRSRKWQCLNKFPGDYPLPFIGNALKIGFNADDASVQLMNMWEKHGKTNFRLTMGSEEWVMLSEPDDVAILMSSSTEINKAIERNSAMEPFFGNSLSSAEGEKWRSTRKMMTPSFGYKTLESRVALANERCGRLIELLTDCDGQTVNVYRYLKPHFFDIGCNALMGVDYDFIKNIDDPYIVNAEKVVKIVTQGYFSYWRLFSPIYKLSSKYREEKRVVKLIRNMSDKIIMDRKMKLANIIKEKELSGFPLQVMREKLSEELCLLDNLLLSELSNGDPIPDSMVNDEISFMSFTSYYILTLTVSHSLYCIAKYPGVQNKVFNEQKEIFANKMTTTNQTMQDLNKMTYLEAVLKESMRLIPTVTVMGRTLQNDLILKDGRIIPASSDVFLHYQAVCMNEKVFHNPEQFIPERFLENNLHPYAFVPAGSGRRNCLGFRYGWLVMKATLANIVRRFEFSSAGPQAEPQFVFRILTESLNGIQLQLKRRDV